MLGERGRLGEEMNEAMAEASGKVPALWTRTGLQPSLVCLSKIFSLLFHPVISLAYVHSILNEQCLLGTYCRTVLHVVCYVYVHLILSHQYLLSAYYGLDLSLVLER